MTAMTGPTPPQSAATDRSNLDHSPLGISAAMILAAGFGTRMRALAADRPKPLVPVAGRALIDHALDRVAVAGVPRAVVNLHHMGGMIRAHLAGRRAPRIAFSEEHGQILDTGGGIAHALPLLGAGPFFTMNPDGIWLGPCPLTRLAEAWRPQELDALLLLVPRERAHAHAGPGDFFLDDAPDRDGMAAPARLARRGGAASAPFVHTGIQLIAPAAFSGAPPGAFSLNIVWDRLIAAGRLGAVVHLGDWVDAGTPEGVSAGTAALKGAADSPGKGPSA